MVAVVVLAMPQYTTTETITDQVAIRLTTGDELHKFVTGTANFSPGSGSNPFKIQVTEAITYQQMDGIGAALTDSSAWLITNTPAITRTKVLSDLFSSDGIGISYVRLPMGASEFVTGTYYTYDDDLPPGITDTQLVSFTIDHDRPYIIPILREAMRLNPELKVIASPWSAPAWMKSSGTLTGGGSLKPEYYQVYANYFVSFTQAYSQAGIPIHAITIQNEPYHTDATYPTMWMEPEEQAHFVKHLGPTFVQNGISTTIFIWDYNWDGWNYPLTVLSDTDAINYIKGSAWHCYAGTPDAQARVYEAHPDKDIYFTECTGDWGISKGFAGDLVWGFQNVAIGATRNWAKTILYWNLALLDENHGPHIGGCSDCRGLLTIDQDGTVTNTVEYYVVGHLSKFVEPGAYRIESSYITGTLESVAFQNPDKSIVLVVLNPGTVTQTFDVQWNGQYFPYTLARESVATFKWRILRVYLPLVLKDYRSPVSFQNFEANNGTPGDYFRDVWHMTCSFESTIVHEGRSVRCQAHAGDMGSHGGTVAIYPSSSKPIDLSSGSALSVWVYDTQGSNTVELRLCNYDTVCSNNVWSERKSSQNEWTEITWPLSALTGVDKSKIRSIQIYEWNDGMYYFDDITWK